MKNKIQHINLADSWNLIAEAEGNVANSRVVVVTDSNKAARPLVVLGQPYLLAEGRFIHVVSGTAKMVANMRPFELSNHHVISMPPGTIFQYDSLSEDFRIEVFSFTTMPEPLAFGQVTMLELSEMETCRMSSYLRLMLDVLKQPNSSLRTIQLLQMAVYSDLQQIHAQSFEKGSGVTANRQEQMYNHFIDLVNEFGSKQRNIRFYADRLAVSPNRLSTVIKECSGRTVMQWLNEATILRAKVLLRHSDKMIYEISDELEFPVASSFVRFFKKNVGITPLEYRRNT